jgi:hypothetical protein
MRRTATATAASLVFLLSTVAVASASYPPGTFPGAAPGGAFRTVVMSRILCAAGGSLQASYDRSAIVLQVPAGSLKNCTQVSLYAAETAVISPLIPRGDLLVDAFAVGWDVPGPAAKPLSLTINDAAITDKATVFETTTTGVAKITSVKVQPGAVTMSFLTAPGYVVTLTAAAPSASPSKGAPSPSAGAATPSASALAGVSSAAPPSGAPDVVADPTATASADWMPVAIVIGLVMLGLATVALVRYRRSSRRI